MTNLPLINLDQYNSGPWKTKNRNTICKYTLDLVRSTNHRFTDVLSMNQSIKHNIVQK